MLNTVKENGKSSSEYMWNRKKEQNITNRLKHCQYIVVVNIQDIIHSEAVNA